MFNLDVIITFIPIISSLGLGTAVYFGKKDLSNKIFGLLCFSVVLWAIANYLSLHSVFLPTLFWIRLVMFFAVFLQFMFFLFVYLFPQNKISMPKIIFAALALLTVATMSATVSNLIYTGLENRNGEAVPVPGVLMPLFVIVIFLFLGLSAFYTLKKYYTSKDAERAQWRSILMGFFMMFFLLISSQFIAVVVFQDIDFIKFGPLFTLPFIVFSAYAITKHHLLNIKVIAAELLTIFISLILLIKVFLSQGIDEFALNSIILLATAVFGVLLIKAVLREVRNKEQIELLSKAKSEFISIASHQLRTPLTAIKGYVSLVLEGNYGELTEKLKKIVGNVYEANERLLKLMEDLLSVSRIESGKIGLTPEMASLEDIIDGAIRDLNPVAQKKSISLEWQKPETALPKISIDKAKIREAILNIIDNAIKYTGQGRVTIKSQITNNKLQISVSDAGVGMTKEEISHLFESFSREAAGRRLWAGGTGLGLYTARKFVEMHQGKIWAESEGKDKGSTFYIELSL